MNENLFHVAHKITLLVCLLPIFGMAQITQQQTIGAPHTQVTSRGFFDTDSAIHMPADTTRSGRIGSLAVIGKTIWIQAALNGTDSSWIPIAAITVIPVSIGAIDSLPAVANGARVNSNRITLQSVKITGAPGLLTTPDYNHFLTTYRYFQSTLGTNFIGHPDTTIHTPTGTNNLLFGSNAGVVMTTGSNNTALGSFAMNASTTGLSNTALGVAALESNVSGINNVAIGVSALANDVSSSGNTAVGTQALVACRGCTFDVAVGLQANTNCTNCASNTVVGQGAAQNGTTGSFNTVVGSLALNRLTTGNSNTAVGFGANSGNTTAGSNTAIGNLAMDFNTIGNLNTVVGAEAMAQDSIGFQNIAIGNLALTGFGDTNCIVVGNKSLYGIFPFSSSGTRGSNRSIAIGDSIGFFVIGGGTRFTNCILVGNHVGPVSVLDTIRINDLVVGNDIKPDTDNVAIFANNSQHIRLGNGGGTTAQENSAAPDVASDLYYNIDSAGYVMSDGSYRYKWRKIFTGSFSQAVTAVANFTITLPVTVASATYTVTVTPTAALSAALFFVTNKTTTSFQVTYLTALTGTVNFDWSATQ